MATPPSPETRAVLRLTCRDRPGLVADVSGLLFRLGANIVLADQHMDPDDQTFFQRVEFTLPRADPAVRTQLLAAGESWQMRARLRFQEERRRVAILVSKRGHCALDLLQRHRAGELPCEIAFVLSNHDDLRAEVERRGYDFWHEPIARSGGAVGEAKLAQEARIKARLESEGVELVVLARYMQILSPALVAAFPERIINIHHSFLPAFAGADPYRQAYRRGVKLIGATSHYVTAQLDEGPIIAQDVARANHRDAVPDLERKGRDLERVVLAHAVRCHLEDRIIAYGNKTVVFD